MATITIPGMFLTGNHAGRPAAADVGSGSLYSCTTHSLVYQSDGASWTTWATLGASAASGVSFTPAGTIAATDTQAAIEEVAAEAGSAAAPGWASALTGSTTADAFYWDGNDLAGFTEVDITGTTTWTEDDNLVSVLVAGMTVEDANCQLIAHSFSTGDAWDVPLMGYLGDSQGGAIRAGIIFTDGTISTSNCVGGHLQMGLAGGAGTGDPSSFLVGRHGTLTNMNTAPWVLDTSLLVGPMMFPHMRLTYQAANTFRLAFSPDGITYHAFGEADISKTMTPTHVGLFVMQADADGAIFTFGPLRKVA